MLARTSEFFEKLFQRDGVDSGEVRLEDTEPEVFQIILNFIYTEEKELFKNLDYTILLKIVQAAHMWLIREVEEFCTNILGTLAVFMKPELLMELYAGFYLLDNKIFLDGIIGLLQKRSVSDATSLIMELGYDCLKDFVQKSSKIFSESERFAMVESWIQKHAKQPNSTDEYVSILSSIDFKKMTVQQFRDGPGKSKLLADVDKYEIMTEIATKEIKRSKIITEVMKLITNSGTHSFIIAEVNVDKIWYQYGSYERMTIEEWSNIRKTKMNVNTMNSRLTEVIFMNKYHFYAIKSNFIIFTDNNCFPIHKLNLDSQMF
ncbi:BTB/POZ domain-containing protein 1-like isoform X2 [Drosophila bipectinata]|nr:BTB/POZ domain-containing protein 1-like isoform X2 [Drosophila bipectinata]XP_043069223.1 BTB/POZ domain-containing protein 1-like isoform X2 [Drosophila bipectinata]